VVGGNGRDTGFADLVDLVQSVEALTRT
jgi:hypothetical protein